jgi:hypothetical protein
MTRTERIRKLANAIKAFKGKTSSPAGAVKVVWKIPPQPVKASVVLDHLIKLGFDEARANQKLEQIKQLKTYDEYDKWIKMLSYENIPN